LSGIRVREVQIMSHEKENQLELMVWLIVITGIAMGIPGALVFGIMEYVCGSLVFFALLALCFFVFGRNTAPRHQTPSHIEMDLWH
jgi:hypothetical protein